MVNFVSIAWAWVPRYLVRHYSVFVCAVCLCGWVWIKLIIELIDLVNQIALPDVVGLIQSVKGVNRTPLLLTILTSDSNRNITPPLYQAWRISDCNLHHTNCQLRTSQSP